ncbi:MAG: hypothetical protein R3B13_03975 [Polyangiaceae bacterium]
MTEPLGAAGSRRTFVEAASPHFERTLRDRAPRPRQQTAPQSPGALQLAKAPRTERMGRRMDQLMEAMRTPYRVGGKTVRVSPAFRSLHPGSDTTPPQTYVLRIKRAVGDKTFGEIAMAAARATSSRGNLDDIRQVTQALIDSDVGKAKLGTTTARHDDAIRSLMKEHGIGLDCRGFALHSFMEARAENGVRPPNARYGFPQHDVTPHLGTKLKRASLDGARTGDLIRLSPDGGRDHNVILRSKQTLSVPAGQSPNFLGRQASAGFLAQPGGGPAKILVLTVDASWGDGGDPSVGGVERRVWIRNEATGLWGRWDNEGQFRVSHGPHAHESATVYRPKEEP